MSPEREKIRNLPAGVFETVLLYVRDSFPEETFGIDDAAFWTEIEQRAGVYDGSKKEAVFQCGMRGYTHTSLAESALKFFPQYKLNIAFGDMSREEREMMVSRVAAKLYDDFPPRYRARHKKYAYS